MTELFGYPVCNKKNSLEQRNFIYKILFSFVNLLQDLILNVTLLDGLYKGFDVAESEFFENQVRCSQFILFFFGHIFKNVLLFPGPPPPLRPEPQPPPPRPLRRQRRVANGLPARHRKRVLHVLEEPGEYI